VLKSPLHTARLKLIRELFPEARFIHIVRNPYDVFASTVRLWKIQYDVQGLQNPRYEATGAIPSVEDHVLDTFNLLYGDFTAEASKIPLRQFCETRYEDLVRNPGAELQRIYTHLGLNGAEDMRHWIEKELRNRTAFRRNRHRLAPAQRATVYQRWRWFFDAYSVPASCNQDVADRSTHSWYAEEKSPSNL